MKMLLSILLAGAVVLAAVACAQPDAALTARVKAKLAADSGVTASRIEVDTRNKIVTLTGNLDSEDMKNRAIDLARGTSGVLDVVDKISVKNADGTGDAPEADRTLGERIDDAGITMHVKARLLDDPDVKGLKIDVDTREGTVYLTGSVRSEAEKEKAVRLAREEKGVKDVQANLTVGK